VKGLIASYCTHETSCWSTYYYVNGFRKERESTFLRRITRNQEVNDGEEGFGPQ
jgi:hypothetical protein